MPVQNISSVAVHPLVLLSVIDHYNRVSRGTNRYVLRLHQFSHPPVGRSFTMPES